MKLQVGVNIGGLLRNKEKPEGALTIEQAVDAIAEAGFDAIDFGLEWGFKRVAQGQDFEKVFTDIRKYVESKGIRIHQTHARVLEKT